MLGGGGGYLAALLAEDPALGPGDLRVVGSSREPAWTFPLPNSHTRFLKPTCKTRQRARGGGRATEGGAAELPLSRELDSGLDAGTLGSPPKSEAELATQAPLQRSFLRIKLFLVCRTSKARLPEPHEPDLGPS